MKDDIRVFIRTSEESQQSTLKTSHPKHAYKVTRSELNRANVGWPAYK